MKERPIIFNGEMVRAILDGRKIQTRRVMKPQPPVGYEWSDVDRLFVDVCGSSLGVMRHCPYGQPGDHLWIRETWCPLQDIRECALAGEPVEIAYKADWDSDGIAREEARDVGVDRWRPSIFMPRWASRITLEVTGVRVERLQEITLGDIAAEGWPDAPTEREVWIPIALIAKNMGFEWWKNLWDSINTKRGFGWDTNPWVWVIEFRRLE